MKRLLLFLVVSLAPAQEIYDLLLKNGHVIDPKNTRNTRLDIAIIGDRVSKIASAIPAKQGRRVVDVSSYFVTPGLIDLRMQLSGPNAVVADHNALRFGVTTAVDPGAVVKHSVVRILSVKAEGQQTISTGLNRETVMIPRDVMTNVLSRHMAKGLTFEQVIERTTVNAAKALNRPDLGSLEEGGVADIAVFEVDQKKRVRCVMTIRNGRVVWDTEGLSLTDWKDAGPYSNFK